MEAPRGGREGRDDRYLGAGFIPAVNAYARLAEDEYFDEITSIDIVDINAGSHGRYFATNFDPEINFREFTGTVYSWQDGAWQENRMFEVGREWDLPVVGKQTAYLSGHDEVHSLSARYADADVRFWMGFGAHYINVFTVLQSLGLLSEQPVTTAEGQQVVPLKLVKAVTDPSSQRRITPARPASAIWSRAARTEGIPGSSSITLLTTKTFNELARGHQLHRRRSAGRRRNSDRARRVGCKAHGECRGLARRPFLELGEMGLPTVIDAQGDHPI